MSEVVRIQQRGGEWQTIGVAVRPGVFPGAIRPAADQNGPSTMSFTLAREADRLWPDLAAFAAVEYEINGVIVWDGRIKETPTNITSGVTTITLNCVGWQTHLDDDSYQLPYVQDDVTQWKDCRQYPECPLGILEDQFNAEATVSSTGNNITMGWPNGTIVPIGAVVGVVLDLGPDANYRAAAINLEMLWTWGGFGGYSPGAFTMNCYAQSSVAFLFSGKFSYAEQIITAFPASYYSNPGIAQTPQKFQAKGTTGPYRYLHLVFRNASGESKTLTEDVIFTMTYMQVMAELAYLGPLRYGAGENASDLRASDVVIDAVSRVAPLITAAPASPAWSAEATALGPMDYWTFDGSSIPPVDLETGYGGAGGHSLSNGVAPTYGQPSLLTDDTSTGAKFNGTSQFLRTSPLIPSTGLLGVSVEAIIKPEDISSTRLICEQAGVFDIAQEAGGVISWTIVTSAGNIDLSAAVLKLNTPAHVLCTYGYYSGVASMFVNGVLVAESAVAAFSYIVGSSYEFFVGCNNSTEKLYMGVLQKLVVYPYQLHQSQIEQLYKASIGRQYGTVTRTQFKLPGYWPTTARTARAHIEAVNAVHLWRTKMLIGRKLLYAPQATAVRLAAGANIAFQDASANDGEEIYNKVILEGQNAIGEDIRSTMTAGELYRLTAPASELGVPQFLNPGGETAPTEAQWSPLKEGSSTTLSQDATHVFAGSHAIKWQPVASGESELHAHLTAGKFIQGRTYRITFAAWCAIANPVYSIGFGFNAGSFFTNTSDAATVGSAFFIGNTAPFKPGQWTQVELAWTPKRTYSSAEVELHLGHSAANPHEPIWFDELSVEEVQATLVEKQGFSRSKVLSAGSNIDLPTASALASAFLQSSSITPFRGSFVAANEGDVTRQPGGELVHPSELLLMTGELIRIPRINPDTGAWGRDGKIATVTYDAEKQEATVTIDDDRQNLQALIARMAVVSGGGVQ
jgi:hypothetical protein